MIDQRQKNPKDSRDRNPKVLEKGTKRNDRTCTFSLFTRRRITGGIRDRRSRVTRTNEEEDLGGWRHLLLCRLAQIGRGRSLCTLITLMPVLNTLLLDRIRRAYLPWQRPAVPVYPGTLLERTCPLYLTILHFYLASMNRDHFEIQFLLQKTRLVFCFPSSKENFFLEQLFRIIYEFFMVCTELSQLRSKLYNV